MEIWQYGMFLLIGIVVGFVNVMVGGGSLLSIPVMLFMGVPGPVANGTNRIGILAQMVTAVATFFRKGYSDFKLSLTLALAALPGAVIGAYSGTHLEGVWFNRVVAAIMIIVMLSMIIKREGAAHAQVSSEKPKRLLLAHALMLILGFYGGFIQIGAGLLLMPLLQKTLGLDLVSVNMHKAFIVGTYTIAALIVFAWRVEIFWVLGISLAIGHSIGAWLSAQVQVSKGEGVVKLVLNIVLTLFIVKLLFFS